MADIAFSTLRVPSGGVKAVQRGTLSSLSTGAGGFVTTNVTITAVNLNKAFTLVSFMPGINTANAIDVRARLTSSTNLEITVQGGTNVSSNAVEWQVVEFN